LLRGDWVKDQVTREPAGRIGRETESEREAKKGRMDREQMTVVTLVEEERSVALRQSAEVR
jgi:hypothetical protein